MMMMTNTTIEVSFTHPRSSIQFTADIDPQCTGQQAVDGLLEGNEQGPFLEQPPAGQPYQLVIKRTQALIPPNLTFAQAGVINKDVIEVRQAGQGA
jgi:hypothetical protein